MIPLFKPFLSESAAKRVAEVMVSGYIGQGPVVEKFEKALEQWIGPCVTVNSGTSAIWLALDLAGVKYGDKVISTPMTCLATNIPAAQRGARIIWADVNPETGNMDPMSLANLLAKHKPKAVIAVEYGGTPTPQSIHSFCAAADVPLIIDAAHAFGSYGFNVRNADYTCYSFQAIKHLTCGDGGALVVRDPEKREEAILKRWFGLDRNRGGFRCDQITHTLGYKFHMNDISAAIGLANLDGVYQNIEKGRRNSALYSVAGYGHYFSQGTHWLHVLNVKDRDGFCQRMEAKGIQCAKPHSRNDVHPIFWGSANEHLPGVEEFDNHHCAIPNGWWLSDVDVREIINSVGECL